MPITFTDNSLRWQLFNAVATALEGAPALQGVEVVRNPTSAPRLDPGQHLILARWGSDALVAYPGGRQQRRFRLTVVSLASTVDADRDADALHQAVIEVVRQTLPTLNGLATKVNATEQDTSQDAEDLKVEGALVVSGWEIAYEQPWVAPPRLP